MFALKTLLELEGATIHAAAGAKQALEILAENRFDLIVSDIAMPGIDGYELIRRIRRDARHHYLPAIAVTGMGREIDVERALQAGFSGHISKPVSAATLAEKIGELGLVARASTQTVSATKH